MDRIGASSAFADEAGGSDDVQSTQFSLDIGRSALSLRVPHADDIARTCLRRVIVSSVVGTSLGMSAVADAERFTKVRAAYPARFNLAGGWTDTPPFCLERKGTVLHVAGLVDGELPIVATVTRLRTPGIRLAMKDAGSVDLRTDAYVIIFCAAKVQRRLSTSVHTTFCSIAAQFCPWASVTFLVSNFVFFLSVLQCL